MKIEIGQRYRSGPRQRAWTVMCFKGEFVILQNGLGAQKMLKPKTIRAAYLLVGTERELKIVEEFRKRGWPVADDA